MDTLTTTNCKQTFIDIVFDGPPGPQSGRFVEVEDEAGCSIKIGEWIKRPDGYWALRITNAVAVLRAMGFGGDPVDEKIGWLGVYPAPSSKDHFRCEFCKAEHLDCTLIEHAPDCPVILARAAAKAAGIGEG